MAHALREKHPGWEISRQHWALGPMWEARHPDRLMPLLHPDPDGLSAAIGAAGAEAAQRP
jgi:hypothetical protein